MRNRSEVFRGVSEQLCYHGDLAIQLVKRYEVLFIGVCMMLLAVAAGWLLLTRPAHRSEGDFLEREDRRVVDEWLTGQLQSPIAETRVRALRALGRIGDPSSLDLLLEGLRDEIPRVRAEAAFAIGEMEDRETLAELGLDPEPRAAAALIGSLGDAERGVITSAVEALGKLGWRKALPAITRAPAPPAVTIQALVRLGDPAALGWIAERRLSDVEETRWAATLALSQMEATIAADAMEPLRKLTEHGNPWIRLAATKALARASVPLEAVSAMKTMAADEDPKVRIEALRTLAALRAPDALPVFIKSLGDPNEQVRLMAVQALGETESHSAVPLLQSLRGRPELISIRAEAVLIRLGAAGDLFRGGWAGVPEPYRTAAAAAALLEAKLARDPSGAALLLAELWDVQDGYLPLVRPAALRAMARAGLPALDAFAARSIHDPRPAVRQAALEVWRNPVLADCRDAFERARRESSPPVQLAALDAAARGRQRELAKPLFLAALDDPDRLVRKRAIRYLRRLFGEDHLARLGPADVRYSPADYQRIARSTSRRIRMETSLGMVELKLDYENARLTSENFVELARKGFYDGQRFAEVIPGDYAKVSPEPGAGYAIRTEISTQPLLRGSLAMAEEEKDSGGAAFFICLAPQPMWEGRYTNFGRLISGDSLLDRITTETRILRIDVP